MSGSTYIYVYSYMCILYILHIFVCIYMFMCMFLVMYVCTSSSSFFSLTLDSSVGLSASIQSAGELVSGVPGSNPAFSRGTQLVSFRFEYRLPVPEYRN